MKTAKISFCIIVLLAGFLVITKMNSKGSETFKFGTTQIPFSSDPMDYDYYIHHVAFASVFGKLVSTDSLKGVVPILSEKWSNDDNFKTWQFKIRENLKFSNGDQLTIEDIILNFKRIIYLKNKSKSHSGLFEYIKGFNEHTSLTSNIEGLSHNGNSLVLKFIKPMPNLLSLISFGFYGIAHPSLYNHEDGVWIDKRKVISSGAYEVSLWDDENYQIKLREELPFVEYDKRLTNINFVQTWQIKRASDLDEVDLLISDRESLLVDERFEFIGSKVNLNIGYVRCNHWDSPSHPLSDLNTRKWLRQKFYEGLMLSDFKITNSFLPPQLTGIRKVEVEKEIERPSFEHFKLFTHGLPSSLKLEENSHKLGMAEIFSKALKNLGNDSGVTLLQEDYLQDDQYDVFINGSGVESSDYLETVRFMFLSKNGIQLPDATGKILEELNKEKPDINIVNQELYNQAIIWPIRHYSTGYWFNKYSNIDYGEMNFDSASIDFQFLKWQ